MRSVDAMAPTPQRARRDLENLRTLVAAKDLLQDA